jgi:hypothetical protein
MGNVLLAALIITFSGVAVLPVLLAHALGRYGVVRLARLPLDNPRLRLLIPVGGADRTGARLGALAAGTAAAYLAVAALVFGFATCHGLPTGRSSVVVADVMDGYPADGKLQPGDRILAVDRVPLQTGVGSSLKDLVSSKEGAPVTLTVRRADALLDVEIRLEAQENDDHAVWLVGARLTHRPEVETGAAAAAGFAIRFPIAAAPDAVLRLANGLFPIDVDDEEAGGPVRIVDEFRASRSSAVSFHAWRYGLPVAAAALLVLAALDVVAAVGVVRSRGRRRRTRHAA